MLRALRSLHSSRDFQTYRADRVSAGYSFYHGGVATSTSARGAVRCILRVDCLTPPTTIHIADRGIGRYFPPRLSHLGRQFRGWGSAQGAHLVLLRACGPMPGDAPDRSG